MTNNCIEVEIVVHPIHGMQLSEGYIRQDNSKGFVGRLPGLLPSKGKTQEEVRVRLENEAKAYYGDDVVVEMAPRELAS